jgi:hypothetical protein
VFSFFLLFCDGYSSRLGLVFLVNSLINVFVVTFVRIGRENLVSELGLSCMVFFLTQMIIGFCFSKILIKFSSSFFFFFFFEQVLEALNGVRIVILMFPTFFGEDLCGCFDGTISIENFNRPLTFYYS